MNKIARIFLSAVFLLLAASGVATGAVRLGDRLSQAIADQHRDPANALRDRYRHPHQVLEFFGVKPDMTVVEIWPSSGWWTEILAPYLRDNGTYYAASFAADLDKTPAYQKRIQQAFLDKLKRNPELYDQVKVTELAVPERTDIAPNGSADMVLTFRNAHNWVAGGYAEQMFQIFYRVLKPGGVLGIVDHRADPGTPLEVMKKSGYLTEKLVIDLAQQAGFKLEARSEVNANPLDPKVELPNGVWTLPPTLDLCNDMKAGAEKDACVAKYTAIGESDRMTLRFRKPGG